MTLQWKLCTKNQRGQAVLSLSYLSSLPGWRRCRPWWQCEPGPYQRILHPGLPEITTGKEFKHSCNRGAAMCVIYVSGRNTYVLIGLVGYGKNYNSDHFDLIMKYRLISKDIFEIPLLLRCWFSPPGWPFHRLCGQQRLWAGRSCAVSPCENSNQSFSLITQWFPGARWVQCKRKRVASFWK